jgi:integrase/recombinase XerC
VKRKRHQIKLKDTDIKHTQMIYPEQWEVLIEKTWRVEDRLLLSLMYYGGLRISEVAKLFSHALDYENKILTVARKGGKLHRFRPIECPHLAQMWKAVLNRKTEEFKFLFAKRANQIPSARALYARVKKLLLHAGLPDELSPHSFRKACGTMLYQRTKDLLYVKDYLNHSDARVTQTYIDTLYLTQHGQMPSFQVQ